MLSWKKSRQLGETTPAGVQARGILTAQVGAVNGMSKYLPIQLIVPRLGMQLCKRFMKRKDD